MHLLVDLPAVRAGRYARAVIDTTIADAVRDLRPFLRGARQEPLPNGIRLTTERDAVSIAELADQVRALGGIWPFLHLRLSALPPHCCLEVCGDGAASAFAQAVFAEIAA